MATLCKYLNLLITALLLNTTVFAADNRTDYDLDDDGLIEINDLSDLYEIRNNLNGTTLYGSSKGCPSLGCHGFELTVHLDFDTNTDGIMDAGDNYWNSGNGWIPIGNTTSPFSAIFDGNGHLIRNLYINRNESHVGLFGRISNASIRNLGLTGGLMRINGTHSIGSLTGDATNSTLSGIFNTGPVSGRSNVGGLIGSADGNTTAITACFNSGPVVATLEKVGGLIGSIDQFATLRGSYATGYVSGSDSGGLAGGASFATIANNYWATDTSDQARFYGQSFANRAIIGTSGATLIQMRCPISSDDTACAAGTTLYQAWNNVQDIEGNAYWDFGNAAQLPGLNLKGTIYRDSDGDGALDGDDAWPDNFAASIDSDGDGHPDFWTPGCDDICISASGLLLDNLPDYPAAWQDSDLDGHPESWADSCNPTCQANSGLTLDNFPDDYDNDGLNTATDTDDNGDGITDADADSDGLVDINNLAELDAMRYNLTGSGRNLTSDGATDSSGCPMIIVNGRIQNKCRGYELLTDLNFDTNADGIMDSHDRYWNGGQGWTPIGDSNAPLTATFNGNGHLIRNLYINSVFGELGLFGNAYRSNFSDVGLSGKLMNITGSDNFGTNIGGLAGYVKESVLTGILNTGAVSGHAYVGGVVGQAYSSSVSASFNTGPIHATWSDSYTGGLIGFSYDSTISGSFSTGRVSGGNTGGLISGFSNVISSSYWATDTSGQNSSADEPAGNHYQGALLTELQCPFSPNNSSCKDNSLLFYMWSDFRNANDIPYWDFGNNSQLPGLKLNGKIYRDSDGDGTLDDDDSHPYDYDNDQVNDKQDAFPADPTESADSDGDGTGDNSDAFPEDASETRDSDNDGVGDNADAFPGDPHETTDSDNDGIGDNADNYPLDRDNDGVTDASDPDNSADNGSPEMLSVGDDVSVSATGENGTVAYLDYSDLLTGLSAMDAVDASVNLTYKGYLSGKLLTVDHTGLIHIKTGRQIIRWTATDISGNESTAMEQTINVFPQVRFSKSESMTGENSIADIAIELSGESPLYPVTVQLSFDVSHSSATEADFKELDLNKPKTLIIEAGTEAQLNTQGKLSLLTLDDNTVEADDQLLINLDGVTLADEYANNYFTTDHTRNQHLLTITDTNLPPEVSLSITQNGEAVSQITIGGGDATITARVSDNNGNDSHTLNWNLNGLTNTPGISNTVTFNTDNLNTGEYQIQATVTDNGSPPLTDEATLSLTVIATSIQERSSSDSGGGGSLIWLLLISPLFVRTHYRPLVKQFRHL